MSHTDEYNFGWDLRRLLLSRLVLLVSVSAETLFAPEGNGTKGTKYATWRGWGRSVGVAAWRADYSRGRRPFDLTDPGSVADRAYRNLAGYGPLEPLLADDDVWEICVNAPDAIFVKRHRGLSGYHDEVFHDDEHVLRTLTKLLDDAGGAHRKLDAAEGLQDAQLDDGARLHIVHGDVGRGGHVIVNIRKFTGVDLASGHSPVRRISA
jgi:hypothetical protein